MARTLWKGSISFGLVNVPVRMATAVSEKGIHFHMLSKDGSCRLRRKLVCPETGEEYDFQDTARGYEVAPDQYLIIKDEEIDKIKPEKGRTIDIVAFIKLAEIDPVYYDRTYYLLPDEGGSKAYQLLIEAMAERKTVALARFVLRERQHLAALRPMAQGGLALHTMHYEDEVTHWKSLRDELPQNITVAKQEMAIAGQLIDALTQKFKPQQYEDEYRKQLEALIHAKVEGQEAVTTSTLEEDEIPPVYNLMDALKKSVQQKKGGSGAASTGTAARKKAAPPRKRRRAS